jgi:hypothetical protein
MFSVGLFYTSLGVLLGLFGFRWLENQELGDGARYFSRTRAYIDTHAEAGKRFIVRHLSMTSIGRYVVHVVTTVQHYAARSLAQLGHVLEHRARKVVHRTARRVRTEGHYLEKEVSPEHTTRTSDE